MSLAPPLQMAQADLWRPGSGTQPKPYSFYYMNKNTLTVLGEVLRQQLALPATRESKELRRLIVRLERRQRERDRQRDRSTKREPH